MMPEVLDDPELPFVLRDGRKRKEFLEGFMKACKTNRVTLRPQQRHKAKNRVRYSDWFFRYISNAVEDIRERVFDGTFQEFIRLSYRDTDETESDMILCRQIEWFKGIHLNILLSEIHKLKHLLRQLGLDNPFAQRLIIDLDEFSQVLRRKQISLENVVRRIMPI